MKKLILPILIFTFLLAACSSEDPSEEANEPDEKASEETGVEANHPEVLFTYEFSKGDRYDFTGIDASIDGSTILFKTKEEIKRDSQRYEYIIVGDDEAKNIKELSEASAEDLDDQRCSRTFISPDGRYLTYSCAKAENWFVVYDTQEQQVVHHQEQLDDRALNIFGITNDMDVLLENNDHNKIAIYHLDTRDMKEFSIPELSGIEDDHYTNLYIAEDGKKIVMNNQERISMLDTESGTLEEVMNVEPYVERFKDETDGISLGTLRVSPNGKYLFFLMGGSLNKETVYQSIHFLNLETGERKSFTEHEYQNFRSIDNDGNILIGDNDQMFLYNIDSDTTYHIPNVEIGTYTEYITLSGDGKHLLYADRIRNSDEQPAYELFHLAIEELDTYEVVDFMATPEDTEALLGEVATTNNPNSGEDGIALTPVKEDVRAMYEARREESATVLYPTSFPEEVTDINDSIRQDSFTQTIHLDPTELIKRQSLLYAVNSYPDTDKNDFCIHDDLELEETKDGIDYYFYLFSNEDAELAFVMDDLCYELEGKGFTKEEMFDVIGSLETQGERLSELPLAEIKFPTELPQENAEIRSFSVVEHVSDYSYHVAYSGDENELDISYWVAGKEPKEFNAEENVAVEVNDSTEAYYNESTLYLYMYDGNYYHTIRAQAKNEVVDGLGGEENIKEVLIEIANSLE